MTLRTGVLATPACGAERGSYRCNREGGHVGDHIFRIAYASWANDTEPSDVPAVAVDDVLALIDTEIATWERRWEMGSMSAEAVQEALRRLRAALTEETTT